VTNELVALLAGTDIGHIRRDTLARLIRTAATGNNRIKAERTLRACRERALPRSLDFSQPIRASAG
jgi:hypothetical protein